MFSEAEAYERFMGRWSRLLAVSLVELSAVHDGDVVLDVGSGTGALSFAVRDVTATTRVIGVDPSRGYVDHANANRADPRVAFEVGDAQQLRFADASFDRSMSLLVLNFVPDPLRAVREMGRVTKPGGIVSAAVWDYGEGMEMLRVFWDEATALDPSLAVGDEKHMKLCKPGELAAAWREAGLVDVEEGPLEIGLHFASFDDYWEPFRLGQGPAGAIVARMPPERQAGVASRIRRRVLGEGPDRPFTMRGRAWAVRGAVPGRT